MVDQPCHEVITSPDGVNTSTLWHQRFGHMSVKNMKILASKWEDSEVESDKMGYVNHGSLGSRIKLFHKGKEGA